MEAESRVAKEEFEIEKEIAIEKQKPDHEKAHKAELKALHETFQQTFKQASENLKAETEISAALRSVLEDLHDSHVRSVNSVGTGLDCTLSPNKNSLRVLIAFVGMQVMNIHHTLAYTSTYI